MPWRRIVHARPIYATVGGKGARVEKSIAECQRLLDAFETYAETRCAEEYRAELTEALAEARRKLEGG